MAYDEKGNIIGLNYNNTQYYYIRNGQNDVIGILDSNLNQVVSYEYDSWGNTISIKDANGNDITDSSNIGIINPYRYRSYRYDTEIGLYYLNSRYYNPEWGRFINADGTTKDDNAELIGHNMYLYCANNPINFIDPMGQSIVIISVGIIVVAVVGIAIIPPETWQTMGEMVGAIASGIVDISKDVVKYIKDSSSKNKKNVKVKNNNTSNSKSKKQSKSLPTVSEPNTSLDLKGKDGSLKLRRYYGPDGRAIKDIDYKHPDNGTHKFPHEHDWNWDNGTPQRSKYSK